MALKIPQEYALTENDMQEILSRNNHGFLVHDYSAIYDDSDVPLQQNRNIVVTRYCYCSGHPIITTARRCFVSCCRCGRADVYGRIDTIEYKKSIYNLDVKKSKPVKYTVNYVKKNPFVDNGILFFKCNVISVLNDDNHIPEVSVIPLGVLDIRPGECNVAYKLNKNSMVPTDRNTILNLNSKTISSVNIIFKDSESMLDFLFHNEKFAQYTGILTAFVGLNDVSVCQNSFFLVYLNLLAYPCIEQIVKMGHNNLIQSIVRKMLSFPNQRLINNMLSDLSHFINVESTNGSTAFIFPKFVADHLRDTKRSYDDYQFWGSIYSNEYLSVEQFHEALALLSRHALNRGDRFARISIFGYKLLETLRYLVRIDKNEEYGHEASLIFADYLGMCHQLNIQHDRFPSDLFVAHDNLAKMCAAHSHEIADASIHETALAVKAMIDTTVLENDKLQIVIPEKASEIIEEAQMQHNCVASYISSVAQHQCLIFFIRQKDDPKKSYITVEYRNGTIAQIKYKFNSNVYNQMERKFANDFVKNLILHSPNRSGDMVQIVDEYRKRNVAAS